MKRWLPWVAMGLVIAVLAGCKGKSAKDEITYETGTAEMGDVRSFVTATGTIQPWKTVDIKSNVAGRIDKLYVDLGQTVKAGDRIMDIDPTDTATALKQAEADQKAAEARRTQAQISVVQERLQANARLSAARRSLESAKARLAQADANAKVQPALTQSAIAQAEASLASAEKAKTQAERNRDQMRQQLAMRKDVSNPFELLSATTSVEQARANVVTQEAEYRRQRQLLAQGFASMADVQTAYSRYASAKATHDNALQRSKTQSVSNNLNEAEMASRLDEAGSRIDETEARINQAKAALDLANQNKVQIEVRRHERAAAQAAVKQAEADIEVATAALQAVAVRQQDIASAESQIVRAQAAQSQASTNLGYTTVVAPRDGIVIAKNVEEGTVVPSSRGSIGSTNALIQIGDVSKLWVVCNVDETDIGQISEQQKVTIKVDAYPSLLPEGKVIRIDPQAKVEQNVTLIPVTVEIDDPDRRFKPLMNAECEFIVDEALQVLTVPNEALKEDQGAYTVTKMGPDKKPTMGTDGKPKPMPVEVGLAGADRTEIKSGLKEGELVITKTIVPEKPQANNPFNPFGGMGGRPSGGARPGGGGAGGGGRPGGGGGR